MPPWIGYCETTSPNTSETRSWPAPTMTIQKIEGGPPVLSGEREERVDADERREIGEAEGEVRPQRHRAVEGILVPQDRQMLAVGEVVGGGRIC